MYRGHTTAVVVPAYNEEQFVADTVASVPGFVDRVYVVDDGSTDDTWDEIVAAAAAANAQHRDGPFDQRVVPVQHDENRGVGGAIKTGYLRARDDRVDLTAVMGGDGQMEPEMLGDLFDPIVDGDADYVKGNRFLDRTGRGDMPAFRFVGNATLAALTKIASGYWAVGDPQSGYTAISLRALDEADVESMYEFYGYCNDLLVKLNVAGLRVVDVPRPITYGDEESHIKYHTYVPRVSAMLGRNFLWRLKTNYLAFDFHPLAAAYAAGGVASLTAVLAAVWALPGVGSFGTPVARGAVAVAFGLLGVLALVFAMALDRADNADRNGVVRPATDAETGDADAERAATTAHLADGRGRPDDGATAVELEPREWAYVLDGDARDPPSVVAQRVRERVRDRWGSEAAAD